MCGEGFASRLLRQWRKNGRAEAGHLSAVEAVAPFTRPDPPYAQAARLRRTKQTAAPVIRERIRGFMSLFSFRVSYQRPRSTTMIRLRPESGFKHGIRMKPASSGKKIERPHLKN